MYLVLGFNYAFGLNRLETVWISEVKVFGHNFEKAQHITLKYSIVVLNVYINVYSSVDKITVLMLRKIKKIGCYLKNNHIEKVQRINFIYKLKLCITSFCKNVSWLKQSRLAVIVWKRKTKSADI